MASALGLPRLWQLVQPRRPISAAAPAPAKPATNSEQRRHRLAILLAEQERQLRQRGAAASAIEVSASHPGNKGDPVKLTMKQGVSTPMDVARELLGAGDATLAPRDCALAVVNDTVYWDMHRPLTKACSVRFLRFLPHTPASKEAFADMKALNAAMWRSGALLLGSLFETAFKPEFTVKLISSPPPFYLSGSFVYDCQVTKTRTEHSLLQLRSGHCLDAWSPSRAELRALTGAAVPLLAADVPFEPLDLPLSVALGMFRHNDCKAVTARRAIAAANVASASSQNGDVRRREPTVTVYRAGDFVDLIGPGPMLARTGLIGHLLVAAVHRIESPDYGPLARVQGAALPAGVPGSAADSIAAALERASILNTTYPPTKLSEAPAAAAAQPASAPSVEPSSPLRPKFRADQRV